MNIAFDHAPKRFNSRCREIFERTSSIFSLVDSFVNKVFFAVVVSTPIVSVNFTSIYDVVTNHLKTSSFCPVFHYESSNIFRPSFIKSENPNNVVLPTFCVMSELTLVYFNTSVVVTKLIALIIILKINMDKLSNFGIDIIHIGVLKVWNLIFFQISKSL